MGSPAITILLSTHRMSLFKALLFLPALSVVARAAPTEVVAGRVVTHAVPSLSTLHHTRTVPTHALHSVHAVPAVHAVHAVSPAVTEVRLVEQENDKVPAQYNFGYSISDSVTGDSKSRQESRDGDAVTGSYSVADPDGRIRTVTYTADDVHGFQATVTYDGAEGPVAIPFDTHSTPAITPVRTVQTVQDVHAVHNRGNTVTAVRTVPTVQDVHAVHNLGNTVTAVRTVPTVQDVHDVHNLGNTISVVRTVPAVQDVHAGHNLGYTVTAVATIHTNHAGEHFINGLNTVRTVPSLQSVQDFPFLLSNSNLGTSLDLSQFRFVNAGQVV